MKKFLIAAIVAATTAVTASAASATTFWVEHGITLNARSGPGTYYDVVGKLHPCRAVHVVGYHKGWAKVSWKGHYYWVSAKYLSNHKCQYSYAPKKKHYVKRHYVQKHYKPTYGYSYSYGY